MNKLIIFVLPLFLSGCFQASFFKKSDDSGVPSGEVLLWYPNGPGGGNTLASDAPPSASDQIAAFLKENLEAKALSDQCYVEPRVHIAPVAIPLVTALAKLGFDMIVDQKVRALDELKKRSVQTYSTTEFEKARELPTWSCLGIARITKDHPNKGDSHLGMISLLEIIHLDANGLESSGLREPRDPSKAIGMRLKPLFVRSFDSVAITKQGAEDSPEVISLSFALALKGIEHAPDKLPQAVAFGAGTMSVPKVQIGKAGETKICKNDECGSTGLIPLPKTLGPLELTLAVTETGNVGFDIDLVKAQLAAFKAAMGPALSSALETRLKED